jgi:hypothetical protein
MKTKKLTRLSTSTTVKDGDLIAPALCRYLPAEEPVRHYNPPTPEQDEAMWAALCQAPAEYEYPASDE